LLMDLQQLSRDLIDPEKTLEIASKYLRILPDLVARCRTHLDKELHTSRKHELDGSPKSSGISIRNVLVAFSLLVPHLPHLKMYLKLT
jgi:hypothetical protein